ncbi:MAG: hypothetical protein ABSE05_00005 [Syntrophales bacterium]|jgi:hypothetical protein
MKVFNIDLDRSELTVIELLKGILFMIILVILAELGMSYYITKSFNVMIKHDLMYFAKAEQIYYAENNEYLGAVGDYVLGGNPPSGTLIRSNFLFSPSNGVRIEIISGNGKQPLTSVFKAESSHDIADVKYEYDFSSAQVIEKEK